MLSALEMREQHTQIFTFNLPLPEDEDEEHEQHAEGGHVVHGLHEDN